MQITPAQLAQHLGKALRGLYVLHGDEALLAQEAADAIRAAARAQGYTERTVHTVQGAHFDWGAVLAAGASLSLFAQRQIVEIRIPSGKPGKDGSAALQRIAEDATGNTDTLTLVTLPRLDFATRKSAWFAALEGSGVSIAVDTIDRAALPQWIAQRLARHGLKVVPGEEGQQALQFFADRVEGNLLAAHQEVEKLALLHPPGELSLHSIEQSVLDVARYDVFKLGESVLAGQLGRAVRMLDGLQSEGVAPVLVHWTLSEEIRALKRVRDAIDAGRPLPMALREARVWGAKERLYERVIGGLDATTLAALLQAAHRADGIVKGLRVRGWPTDAWEALLRLVTQLAAACRGKIPA